MFYLVLMAQVVVLLAVPTAVVGLLVVHAAYAAARLQPDGEAVAYGAFLKKHVTRRRALMTVVGVPLLLLAVATLAVVVETPVRTATLRSSLGEATSLRVRSGGHCHRDPAHEIVLFETTDRPVIDDVLSRLTLTPSFPLVQCRCCGDMTFEFRNGSELLGAFSFHHGSHIRLLGDWYGDRYLTPTSQQAFNAWLDQHDIREKLEQHYAEVQAGLAGEPAEATPVLEPIPVPSVTDP